MKEPNKVLSYPPIPPNCEYFADGEFHWPDTFHWDLNNPHSARPVIARVARGAWLDEAERFSEICWSDVDKVRASAELEDFESYHAAVAFAEAWKKWGLGEPWQK